MIDKLRFQNFKGFRTGEIPLSRLTVVVGPNASGKTSILEGLHLLSQAGSRPASYVFSGKYAASNLYTRGGNGSFELACDLSWPANKATVRVSFQAIPESPGKVLREGVTDTVINSFSETHRPLQGNRDHLEPSGLSNAALMQVRSATLLQLDPRNLRESHSSNQQSPLLLGDGTGLASALAHIATSDPRAYLLIIEKMRAIVKGFRNIDLVRVRVPTEEFEEIKGSPDTFKKVMRHPWGFRIQISLEGADKLDANYASEGTLMTLGLMTVLLGPSRPRLILIDELERGLHPKVLTHLLRQFRELLKEFPDLQIVGTTHSPYLVDSLQGEEVILTRRKDDGAIATQRLSDHPEYGKWKDEFSMGEFWSHVGEQWVE